MKHWREITLKLIEEKFERYENMTDVFTWDDLDDLWRVLDGVLEDNHPDIMNSFISRSNALRYSDKALIPGVHYETGKPERQCCGSCRFFEVFSFNARLPLTSEDCTGNCTYRHLPFSMSVANRERISVSATDGKKCACYMNGTPKVET